MHAKPMRYALGTCLLAATMAAAGHAGRSWFEAAFVLTLGPNSPAGAVLFTRASGVGPEPGVYPLSEDPELGVQALVVTGPPTHPTGAFRAHSGTLTIARSSSDLIEGHLTSTRWDSRPRIRPARTAC